MDDDLIKEYQEVISLLQLRMPGNSFQGDFIYDGNGKTALRLSIINNGSFVEDEAFKNKVFKYMNTAKDALSYFVKIGKNRVF